MGLRAQARRKEVNEVKEELWGIDDPKERRRIERAAKARFSSIGPLFLVMVLIAILGAAIGILLRAFVPQLDFLGAAIAILMVFPMYNRREAIRLRRERIEVLRSLGRCVNCGYLLNTVSDAQCPECGLRKDAKAMS